MHDEGAKKTPRGSQWTSRIRRGLERQWLQGVAAIAGIVATALALAALLSGGTGNSTTVGPSPRPMPTTEGQPAKPAVSAESSPTGAPSRSPDGGGGPTILPSAGKASPQPRTNGPTNRPRSVPLTALPVETVTGAWSTDADSMSAKVYCNETPTRIYRLGGKYAELSGFAGVDEDSPTSEELKFEVSVDGEVLFTGHIGQAANAPIRVDTRGGDRLALTVSKCVDGSYGVGTYVDMRLSE